MSSFIAEKLDIAIKTDYAAISREYFKNEARSTFVTEAAFFSVIVMTAAVPLIYTAMALVHLVRSVAAV